MNKQTITAALNTVGNLMGEIRLADRVHHDRVSELMTSIVDALKPLAEAGVPAKEVRKKLLEWNVNTKDGLEIRSVATINSWMRKAGFRERAKRSDSGTVKADKSKVIEDIKSLMAKHGITVEDLA